jgi:hypothetical protein
MPLNISCLIVMLRLPGKSTGKSALQSLSPCARPMHHAGQASWSRGRQRDKFVKRKPWCRGWSRELHHRWN